jgi:hypothetical protein
MQYNSADNRQVTQRRFAVSFPPIIDATKAAHPCTRITQKSSRFSPILPFAINVASSTAAPKAKAIPDNIPIAIPFAVAPTGGICLLLNPLPSPLALVYFQITEKEQVQQFAAPVFQ